MTSAALELRDVTIGRGRQPVLTGVSARIEPGEFIGVFGPNGAGKSTLFAALLGLLPVMGGEVRVLGQPVRRGNALIGFMPQHRLQALEVRLSGWASVRWAGCCWPRCWAASAWVCWASGCGAATWRWASF